LGGGDCADKWHLGPLRVLNFLALLVLTLRFGGYVSTSFLPRWLEMFGAASLPVFCAHLIVVLLALTVVGDRQGATPLWVDGMLIAGTFIVLYATASWFAPPATNLSAADSTKHGRLLTVRAAR
jgi:hypothetical protein